MRSRTGSPVSNNPGQIQNGTRQYQNQRLNPVIHRVPPTKTQHLPQPRRLLLAQTNGRRITRRVLEKINRNRKGMQLQNIFGRTFTDIQIHDGNHREKTARQIDEGKTLELKKTIELIKQNTYEKNNKKSTKPEDLI